jgi:hypothetical protein
MSFIKKILDWIALIPLDKLLHFDACMFIAFFVAKIFSLILPKWIGALIGFTVAMIFGVLKEIYDSKGYGNVEWKDIKADLIGAVTGSLMALI